MNFALLKYAGNIWEIELLASRDACFDLIRDETSALDFRVIPAQPDFKVGQSLHLPRLHHFQH